jgi:hypothetical protein
MKNKFKQADSMKAEFLGSNEKFNFYTENFDGVELTIMENKENGELSLTANSVAKLLGFDNFSQMENDPAWQSRLAKFEQENGKPLIQKNEVEHGITEREPTEHSIE